MNETDSARIRVYLNDPGGRGDRLVDVAPPEKTESGPWGFRVEGKAPEPRAYAPDTREFLYWQIASALDRGKRLWARRLPGRARGFPAPCCRPWPWPDRISTPTTTARRCASSATWTRRPDTIVQSGDSPDIVTHEQGHAILDAHPAGPLGCAPLRGRRLPRGLRRSGGDRGGAGRARARRARPFRDERRRRSIKPRLAPRRGARRGRPRQATAPTRRRPAPCATPSTRSSTPTRRACPTTRRRESLSAEPHSFCRVITGACWDVLVAIFRASPEPDRAGSARAACERMACARGRGRADGALGSGLLRALRAPRRARGRARTAKSSPPRSPTSSSAGSCSRAPTCRPSSRRTRTPPSRAPGELPSPALVRAIEARLGPAAGRRAPAGRHRRRRARARGESCAGAAAAICSSTARSTVRPTARRSRSPTRSRSASPRPGSLAASRMHRPAKTTRTTRAPSCGFSRGADASLRP